MGRSSLTPATVKRMGGAFFPALGLSPDTSRDAWRFAARELGEIASLLPEPDAWTVVDRGEDAKLLLLAGDAIFTITREFTGPTERHLVVRSRPIRLVEVGYSRDEPRTLWDFQFRDGTALQLEGWMNPSSEPGGDETPDQAETFARGLAAKIGWQTSDQAR